MTSQLLAQIARHADDATRCAYVETATGRVLPYRQLLDRITSLQSLLSATIRPGDVVMLRCGNRVDYAPWFLAILASGGRALPVSPELTTTELRNLAVRAGATAIVGDDATHAALASLIRTGWPLDAGAGAGSQAATHVATAGTGELLLASSGTTGEPKIVRRSSTSLDAVAVNMVEAIGFRSGDRVLACVPLSHSYGLEHGLLAPLWAGSTVHLCDGMDLRPVADALAGEVTIWPAVPSMIETLAMVTSAPSCLPSLRVAYTAGGPLPRGVYERFLGRFNVRVSQLYGMTEIGSVTFADATSATFDPASVGLPMRGVSVRVLDRVGEEGEIAVAAPSMCHGYVGAAVPLDDGHFRTGDLGRIDAHGNLIITGRMRLLIEAGGVKVNPLELEAVLSSHPQVAECVVIPVRQSATVQRIKAVIVPRDPAHPPDVTDLRRFARERLASYKVPRLFEFMDTLPRTETGKVKRQLLETA
jgi:acyl-coenzyme A synthetase/AMP-(fatty) acid ligase